MEDVKLDFPALPPCKEDAEVRGSECGVRLGRAERGTTGGRTDAQTDGRTTQPRPRASRLSSPHSAAFSSDGGAWDRGAGRASPIAQSRTPRPLFSRAGPGRTRGSVEPERDEAQLHPTAPRDLVAPLLPPSGIPVLRPFSSGGTGREAPPLPLPRVHWSLPGPQLVQK